ncbi:MAG TPA: lysophospholipid acyltransferase family protein [Thiobacillaceae bacterium]|nr:lysophospholipid acyltransferase family protein [Thiobacillaceae bacterium]
MALLLRLLSYLPLPILHALGILLGWGIYLTPGRHSPRMRANLRQSGLCPNPACRPLLRKAIGESGKSLMELAPIWMRPHTRTVKLVREVSGWEQLTAALQDGKGVILMSPHIGCFEMINQYVASRLPLTSMYKPARNPVVDRIMKSGRERGKAHLVPTDMTGIKAMLKALRKGEAIGILPDQVATIGDGVWAPFFGRWAYTPSLVFRLAQSTGAAPFMVYAERLPWGRGYHLHFDPIAPFPADKLAAAAQLNREVERVIRRNPAQYLWGYQRYKKPGDAPPPPDMPCP